MFPTRPSLLLPCFVLLLMAPFVRADAIDDAIPLIAAEAEAYVKDVASPLRSNADYFKSNPPPSDAVLKRLDQRLNKDAFVDAYIKWQLLSAVPNTVPADQASTLFAAYKAAPPVGLAPGADPAIQKELQNASRGLNAEGIADLNGKWKMLRDQRDKRNEVLMSYRYALLERMPDQPQVLALYAKEVAEWARTGHQIWNPTRAVESRITAWQAQASEQEKRQLYQELSRLPQTPSAEVYEELEYHAPSKQGVWTKRRHQFPTDFANRYKP